MACETKIWLVLHFLLLAACCMQHCVHGVSQVPCLFIFGDSLSDTGNNNNLSTSAKPIYHPYGIEHPHGPTGRFSDGYTTIDIIGNIICTINTLYLSQFNYYCKFNSKILNCIAIEDVKL